MPQVVYILWAIVLLVVIIALPFLVVLLNQALREARFIEKYMADMLTAGVGIAQNTDHIRKLEDTIQTATRILKTAETINTHSQTIQITLASRAGKN